METLQECRRNIVIRIKLTKFQPLTSFVTLCLHIKSSYYKMGQIFCKIDINIKWDGWSGSVSNKWHDTIRILFLFLLIFILYRSIAKWFSYTYCCCCLVTKLCPTLCNPMNCNPPGSSVHVILQARILEWAAISFSTYMHYCI